MANSTEKIRSGERKFVAVCDLIKCLFVCVVISILGWHTITMFTAALQAKPETLTAFADCLKSWDLMEVLLMLVSIITGCGWYFEHKRNNHLVEKEGILRREKESCDPIHSRSGLNATGATPKN
jgi:hypothetical protein